MAIEWVEPGTIFEFDNEPTGRIVILGKGCRVSLGKHTVFSANLIIEASVTNAVIEIGDSCNIGGIIRLVRGDGGVVRVGEGTTFNQVGLSMHETGNITIGRDCMLSTDIHMDVSDMHPIYDRETGERINPPRDIELADHVWIGTRVLILKGASIGTGAIVGAGSMVTGTVSEHCLAVGSPARTVRENVVWTRDMDQAPNLARPPSRWKFWRARQGSNLQPPA